MERRLSAILVADMVGYSSLMEADEIDTLQRQKVLRRELIDPAIHRYSGRIVKEMGDGLMVEFPSVVDAVSCAVEVQRAMPAREETVAPERRIRYRVGINLGDIVAEEGDIFGDGVNVAARLEQMSDPGGICVAGTAYDHLKPIPDIAYQSLGEIKVKNIDRPIRIYRILIDGTEGEPTPRRTRIPVAIAASLGALMIGVIAAWWMLSDRGGPGIRRDDGQVTLAVLPFQNLGGNGDQDYFVDGMTDDLITDLSKISSLFVIARNSSFAYKGRADAPADIGRELGVRYLLTGSVRNAGGQLRINSRLVDATSGGQVWADRFDGTEAHIFELQDRVTEQIVSALSVELTPAERERISAPLEASPEAYDVYLRGVSELRRFNPDSIRAARRHFLASLAIDPDYAPTHAAMAFSFVAGGIFYVEDEAQAAQTQALLYARRAIELDPQLPQGYFSLAISLQREKRFEEAIRTARRAVELDPNYADAYAALASILAQSGRGEEALSAIRRAMELNPRYTGTYLEVLARAHFALADNQATERAARACIERDPASIICRIFLLATLALDGQVDEAEWEAEELRTLATDLKPIIARFLGQFARAEDVDRFKRGLDLAGLAEGTD